MKAEQSKRDFYNQFLTKDQKDEWQKIFEDSFKLMKERAVKNLRESPDFRPQLIDKIKANQNMNPASFHSILQGLVRIGVKVEDIKG